MGNVVSRRNRWWMRLVGALLAIAAAVACALAIDRVTTGDARAETPEISVHAAQMVQAASNDGEVEGPFEHGVPAGFQEELFSVDGFEEQRCTVDGTVAGMSADASPSETSKRLKREMVERGWTAFDSGDVVRMTFVKDTGAFAWACIDCTAVGDRTSVVVVLQRRDAR
jgi:hypothetical protein